MTKERKRVFYSFILFEYKSMEEYFEKMALQGWMLDKKGFAVLEFRKIQPKKNRFSLDIFPYIGVFDSTDNKRVLEYRDLCQSFG